MLSGNVLSASILLFAGGARLLGDAASYRDEIAEWRKNYDRDLRSDKGPLKLIARHDVPEGRTGIGSDASNAVALPDRAPKSAGALHRQGGKVTFEPTAGIAVMLNGKRLAGPSVLRIGGTPNQSDKLAFGDFEIAFWELGGQIQLTVRDAQSPYLKEFPGTVWFPVNDDSRVEGTFTAYPAPKELKIPDTGGLTRIRKVPGYVTFRLNGETLRLEPVETGNVFFFMFKDRTAGKETYGGGRYLNADLPKDGKVTLDFNKAYNPYCAINPYSSCPIPPKSNTLTMRVEAGEKYRRQR
jgi:uncharacterized protein (DUF1684 family)